MRPDEAFFIFGEHRFLHKGFQSNFSVIMCIISSSKAQYTLPEFRPTEAPEMPKGIFSYRKSETNIQNEMHVPNADFVSFIISYQMLDKPRYFSRNQ